jgi:hypothetical protein
MRLYADPCMTPNNHQQLSAAPGTATQFSRFLEGGSGSGSGRLRASILAAVTIYHLLNTLACEVHGPVNINY